MFLLNANVCVHTNKGGIYGLLTVGIAHMFEEQAHNLQVVSCNSCLTVDNLLCSCVDV